MENIPLEIMQKVKGNAITFFENQSFEDVKATECIVTNRGLCFLNKEQEIVAFMPFTYEGEKNWVEKKIPLQVIQTF